MLNRSLKHHGQCCLWCNDMLWIFFIISLFPQQIADMREASMEAQECHSVSLCPEAVLALDEHLSRFLGLNINQPPTLVPLLVDSWLNFSVNRLCFLSIQIPHSIHLLLMIPFHQSLGNPTMTGNTLTLTLVGFVAGFHPLWTTIFRPPTIIVQCFQQSPLSTFTI